MSLTRRTGLLITLTLLAVAGGCSTEQKYAPSPVNIAPIVGDEAMAARADWPASVCYYANGSTPAYSTRYPYDVQAPKPNSGDVILEPAMFVVQTVMLPIEFLRYPPFKEQIWYGERLPPTYTAVPPLPPMGGVRVPPVTAFPFLGPQATAPDTSLPGAPATPPNSANPQVPTYTVGPASPAATPAPPPGAPGGVTGPPVSR